MTKKKKNNVQKAASKKANGEKNQDAENDSIVDKIGKGQKNEVQKSIEKMKETLDKFSKKVISKFEDYVLGVCLLPPDKEKKEESAKTQGKGAFDVLVLIDDSDSKKMKKEELKERLTQIISSMAEEVSNQIKPDVLILSELWTMCFDAKYDYLARIAKGAIIHDKGMLSAIKIAEIHKTMVLSKFEKYIVSYVLAGSLIQGKATEKSDVDVFVVIDDTDVKRMTRTELKDKLRAIIIGMGYDAAQITGIKNKLNIQVYILTEFWDSLREANPVIFTLLRDGVPFYDRGIFTPWKQLLKMGKIKPSQESIDMFLSTGEKVLQRARKKLTDIGMEDLYYALLTPSQAALMTYGVAPPTPRETVELMRDIFVKKEEMLENEYVDTLAWAIQLRKDVEHEERSSISGKEIDDLLKRADEYLKRINKLFEQIQARKEKESVKEMIDNTIAVARDLILSETDRKKVDESEILDLFNEHFIKSNKVPPSVYKSLKHVLDAKNKNKKLNKVEIQKLRKNAMGFFKVATEQLQRKKLRKIDYHKVKVRYDQDKMGFVVVCENKIFVSKDVTNPDTIFEYPYKGNKIGAKKKSNLEDMEKCILESKKNTAELNPLIIELIEKEFGKNFDILLG